MTPLFALSLGLGCGADPAPSTDPATIQTDPGAYSAAAPEPTPSLRPGAYGVVKLTADYAFEGDESAHFVAQGTGTLLVDGENWLILTARHVVVPSLEVESVHDMNLGPLRRVQSRVAISSLGLEPASLRFSREHDLALLTVAPDDRARLYHIVNRDPAAPIAVEQPQGGAETGQTVEAWGYPARHHPQLETPAVSTREGGYLVLNEALPRGYSGGPVLTGGGQRKALAGVITRAVDEDDQTVVLSWSLAHDLLEDATAPEVQLGATTVIESVPFKLARTLPAAHSQPD